MRAARRQPPCCRTAPRWVQERLGDRQCLAPLTGQDSLALAAFTHLVTLYGCSDIEGRQAAVDAMAAVLRAMQTKCWPLAKASIPHMLDWGHEEEIWAQITKGGGR